MSPTPPLLDDDLHAYVDNALDAHNRTRVQALLDENSDEMARAQRYSQQNAALHTLYDPIADETTPPEMTALVTAQLRKPSRKAWVQIAAAIALFVAGGSSGWGIRGIYTSVTQDDAPYYVTRAVGAHRIYSAEKRHAVEVVAAEEKHLVRWLSKRLGHPLRTPQLSAAGFHLVGGRLLDVSAKPAAQFMYENDSGLRVTIYIRAYDGDDTSFEFFDSGEVSAFYWNDSPFAYALAGKIPRAELLKLAQVVHDELRL